MAIIAPDPIILNNVDLIVGTDNYEVSVSKVELVPTTPTVQWRGMTPTATYNFAGSTTWVANIDYPQDWATANSLAQYLAANVGKVVPIKFKPRKATLPATTAPTYSIDALILPGPIGGAVDSIAAGSVSLPCNGQPVRSVA